MAAEERVIKIVALPEKPAEMIVRNTVPVCISLCEPVCAESAYEVSVSIFDKPVGTITVKGRTRFFNCREEEKV